MKKLNFLISKIEQEKKNIKEAEENIEALKNMIIQEYEENSDYHKGDIVEIEKKGVIQTIYTGVIADFELNNDFEIIAKIFKLKKDNTPSRQLHPNGNVKVEEILKVV